MPAMLLLTNPFETLIYYKSQAKKIRRKSAV
jgi:hypothetical protein